MLFPQLNFLCYRIRRLPECWGPAFSMVSEAISFSTLIETPSTSFRINTSELVLMYSFDRFWIKSKMDPQKQDHAAWCNGPRIFKTIRFLHGKISLILYIIVLRKEHGSVTFRLVRN